MASYKGYYRYKLNNIGAGVTKTITFYNGATALAVKTIKAKDFCTGQRLIKFLCKDGQYRFCPFNKYYDTLDNPQLIGRTNKMITSILTDQSNSDIIGYKNERTLSLTSDDVSETELTTLSDIYTSPRIYLYVGSSTDLDKDWLKVEIKSSDNIVKQRRAKFSNINITIILPENFTIKMI